jgi:hypothetical protein
VSAFEVDAAGYRIRRESDGAWTLTPPASIYGYDGDDAMIAADGYGPESMPLSGAGYAYAPDMGRIIQALAEHLAVKQGR